MSSLLFMDEYLFHFSKCLPLKNVSVNVTVHVSWYTYAQILVRQIHRGSIVKF